MESHSTRRKKGRTSKSTREKLLTMKLDEFVKYSGIYKDKRMAFRLARNLIESLYYPDGLYYHMRKRRVKDLYSLTAEDVFLKMENYGIKTVNALNETLTMNNLPPLPLRLDDISYHPHYRELRKS